MEVNPRKEGGRVLPAEVLWTPQDERRRAKMSHVFGRDGALEVDFGCGDGAFLVEMARRFPERNFLGTERLAGRIESACGAASRAGVSNVRILPLGSAWTVKHLIPAGSMQAAYVSFPDPWPKRRHQPRRLIQVDFLADVWTALAPGGELRLKTDDLPYYRWMEEVAAAACGLQRVDWEEEADYPKTTFEKLFLARRMPIYRLKLRKV